MPDQLKIKTDALKRLVKEERLYKQEVRDHEQYVDRMKANEADDYEIKKQIEVLEEGYRMIPKVRERILELKQQLNDLLIEFGGQEEVGEVKKVLAEVDESKSKK